MINSHAMAHRKIQYMREKDRRLYAFKVFVRFSGSYRLDYAENLFWPLGLV